MDSTQRLCAKAQSGDREAASELVSLFYERIFAYFRRLCRNEEDAADLTQKTFLKSWAGLSSFQNRSSFSTWLHGIAHHVYVDARRKRNFLDGQTDEWWEARATEDPGPFEDVAERDLASRLYALVDQLDDETRESVHLHYYQGLSISETSEVLNIATSTVKYRLRAALEDLRARASESKSASN